MKVNVKGLAAVILLLITGVFLVSCDYLLPSPLGRDNPRDDESQLSDFKAFFSGNKTATLLWDWKSYTGTDPSRKIIKIRIVHSENDPPASMFPLDKSNVQELTSGDSFVWKNLREYSDHYFALYQLEESGTWLKPLYTNFHIEGSGYSDNQGPPPIQYMYADMVPGSVVYGTIDHPSLANSSRGFLIFDTKSLDPYSTGLITAAELQFTYDSSNYLGTVSIVPMKKDVYAGDLWDDISYSGYYDMDHSISISISKTVNVTVDISTVLNYCRLYGTSTIAFIIPPTDAGRINDPAGKISLQNLTVWRTQ